MHLRVVPKDGAGQVAPARRKGGRAACFQLTDTEERALRASIHNIAKTKYGTIRKLAAALGCSANMLGRNSRHAPGVAIALARLTDTSVDSVLGRVGLAALPGGVA